MRADGCGFRRAAHRDLFRDERGLTTVSMAVCMLLSLALIFSAGQLYRIQSASAEVQEVADAAALAAEEEVAEFMVAANACDAVVLSMTLLSGVTLGIGVVASCIPPAASMGAKLVDLGAKIGDARDAFSQRAADGLNALQKALPLLAAAHAARVAQANGQGAMEADYFAAAMLVDAEGAPIGRAADELGDVAQEVGEGSEDIQEASARAEELAEKANAAKMAGFMADCGEYPGRCMAERDEALTGYVGDIYESVDVWDFRVAWNRAVSYYESRWEGEVAFEADWMSIEERADSKLRYYFYQYAILEVLGARKDDGRFVFPEFPTNVDELRHTDLYDDAFYPVTTAGDAKTMHAWAGCPNAAGYGYLGTIRELDGGGFAECEACRFNVHSLASVASATTNTPTGFEYHYERMRRACDEYNAATDELEPVKEQVKSQARGLMERIKDVLANASDLRIHADPPGSKGAVAIVVNTAQSPVDAGFENALVRNSSVLGVRAAVSAATLVADTSDPGASVITSILDRPDRDGDAVVGAARIVLDAWSGLLRAFEDGQAALSDAVRNGLDGIAKHTASGLGTWAADALTEALDAVGLEPAHLDALKPATVNTAHVANAGTGAFSVKFIQMKQQALSLSASSPDAISSVAADVEQAVAASGALDLEITVAEIEFPVGGVVVPIKVSLPDSVKDAASGFLADCIAAMKSAVSSVTGARSWQ